MTTKSRRHGLADAVEFSIEEWNRRAIRDLKGAASESPMSGPGWRTIHGEVRKTLEAFGRHEREVGGKEWAALRQEVAEGGKPTKAEIRFLLRRFGVPADMGAYVERRLRLRDPRGRPRESRYARSKKATRAWKLAWDVALKEHHLREAGARQTRQRAIKETASENNMVPRRLQELLKEGKDDFLGKPGNVWPSREIVARYELEGAWPPGASPEMMHMMRREAGLSNYHRMRSDAGKTAFS